jgi:hypothetical protein
MGKCSLEHQFTSGSNELVFCDRSTEMLTILEMMSMTEILEAVPSGRVT